MTSASVRPNLWTDLERRRGGVQVAALAATALLHGLFATVVVNAKPRPLPSDRIIEMEVREAPPPPVVAPEPPAAPPPPEEPAPRPRIVPRKLAMTEPPPKAAPSPPPPNQEPPPTAPSEAPPVFGVTMSSVVNGESGVAVPLGNTLMTKDRTPATPKAAAQPYAGQGRAFVPVAEVYLAKRARVLFAIDSAEIYPEEARRLGREGTVKLSVGIDESGEVREVKVIDASGDDFAQSAARAMWKAKFSPAETSDGRRVPTRIVYVYRFQSG